MYKYEFYNYILYAVISAILYCKKKRKAWLPLISELGKRRETADFPLNLA